MNVGDNPFNSTNTSNKDSIETKNSGLNKPQGKVPHLKDLVRIPEGQSLKSSLIGRKLSLKASQSSSLITPESHGNKAFNLES